MRSSKSRSRSKNSNNNRNRSVGNIINRVFDSSGPESKVRGTPQQIIEKYNQLARDAQLSNDRVAAENFQQHAEHYTRMLAEAQREMDAKREQQEREHQQRQQNRDDNQQQQPQQHNRDDQPQQHNRDDQPQQHNRDDQPQQHNRADQPQSRDDQQPNRPRRDRRTERDQSQQEQPDVLDTAGSDQDSGLVETPEESQPKKRAPRVRKPKPPAEDRPDTPEAAE